MDATTLGQSKYVPKLAHQPKRRRVSWPVRWITRDLRDLAKERRKSATNGWDENGSSTARTVGYVSGRISMAFLLGRLSRKKYDAFLGRANRIHSAKVTRLDPRLLYVAKGQA